MVSQEPSLPQPKVKEKQEDRSITGIQDILDIAAEAGLKPVGPMLQSGLNFMTAFQPMAFDSDSDPEAVAVPD